MAFCERLLQYRYRAQFRLNRALYHVLYRRYRKFTLVPARWFVENLDACARYAPKLGCIVECGVWRGGMSAAIGDVLPRRTHYLFDSFKGLPPANKELDGDRAVAYQTDKASPWYFDNCRAERSFAETAMSLSHAGEVRFMPGWFNETLKDFAPKEPIAVLRLDGDWYESTMVCLTVLYPHVTTNGLVLIDDYFAWDGCSRAVHDYLSKIKSAARIQTKGRFAYLIKPPEDRCCV
jgi:O-methyltransferase